MFAQCPIPVAILSAAILRAHHEDMCRNLALQNIFEFLGAIAGTGADTVHVPNAPMQPMAADDVVATLADVAVGSPANGVVEVAGPEALSMAAFVGKALAASGDKRSVVADAQARYYGAALDNLGLKPRNPNPRIAPTRFETWLNRSAARESVRVG